MFSGQLRAMAADLLDLCRSQKLTIATAESCTGGLAGALLTDIAGSSDVFERGFITYSNAAKHELLGVTEGMLAQYGAVSEEVAREMAGGALRHSHASLSVAITGIAGPGGGSPQKPVGLVHIASARKDGRIIASKNLFGNRGRQQVRLAALAKAIEMLTAQARANGGAEL